MGIRISAPPEDRDFALTVLKINYLRTPAALPRAFLFRAFSPEHGAKGAGGDSPGHRPGVPGNPSFSGLKARDRTDKEALT